MRLGRCIHLLLEAFGIGCFLMAFSHARASSLGEEPQPEATVAPNPPPIFMIPLRLEASYLVAAADVEVPELRVRDGNEFTGQRSTAGYFTENRLTGLFSLRLSPLQSLRFGLSYIRGRSGVFGTAKEESVPYLLRFSGVGGELVLARHVLSILDLDFGLQGDMLTWGVTSFEDPDREGSAYQGTGRPARLDLTSGYRFGWQAGLATQISGAVGLVCRFGGLLTSLSFKSHPEGIKMQGFFGSLGVALDLGRGEL